MLLVGLTGSIGTGKSTTAAMFKSSKVLAIDLSLSSLAYAKRKTEELAINNIEYMQADILDLGKLNKQFDIIESSGVLHHMDNPIKGWKVLTDCLTAGGLMRIGLYSELARKNIVKIVDTTAIVAKIVSKNTIKVLKFCVVVNADTKITKKIQQIPKIYLMEHKNYE